MKAPGEDARVVTSFGRTFIGRLTPGEVVSWTSPDGVEIDGILLYPCDYDPVKRYPLLVQVHGGPSWGGYLTAWTITRTNIFKAAIMGAGVANLVSDHAAGDIAEANMAYYSGHPYTHWDLYADRSPVRHAAKVTMPTLILHGAADARVHPTQSMEFHRALQVLGVPVRFVRYPRE